MIGAPGYSGTHGLLSGRLIVASAIRQRSIVAGEVVLLPVDPAQTLSYFFGFDAVGEAHFVVNLRQPAMAGQTMYLQVFGLDGSLPLGLASSSGLSLSFVN